MLETLATIVQPDTARTVYFVTSGLVAGLFLVTKQDLLSVFVNREGATAENNRTTDLPDAHVKLIRFLTIQNLTTVLYALATIVLVTAIAVIAFAERELVEPSGKMILGLLVGGLIGHLVWLASERNPRRAFALIQLQRFTYVLSPRRLMLIIFAGFAAWMMKNGINVIAAISFVVVCYALETIGKIFVDWFSWRNRKRALVVQRSEFLEFVEQQLEAEHKQSSLSSQDQKPSDNVAK